MVWSDVRTDLSVKDAEASTPQVAESKTSASSFACMKALGVTPPPADGWAPLPKTERSDSPMGEWQRSTSSIDWIYHASEDRYFHLPSNTLWEQREVDCCDPQASSHTYYRVDALHLQALAQFARHMDSTILPLAWSAWLQYTRKKKRTKSSSSRKVSDFTPVPSVASLRTGTASSLAELDKKDAVWAETVVEQDGVEEAGGNPTEAVDLILAERKLKLHTCTSLEDLDAIDIAQPAQEPMTICVAKSVSFAEDEVTMHSSSEKNLTPKRRGCCPFLCGRCRRRTEKQSNALSAANELDGASSRGGLTPMRHTATTMSTATIRSTETMNSKKSRFAKVHTMLGAKEKDSNAMRSGRSIDTDVTVMTNQSSGPPNPPELDERHTRRLEKFLADIKRNPQRLVSHVEQRRAEKTFLAYIVE